MPTDYSDSANRHWNDGCYLYADNRLANADQLFGLSAECALKAVMLGLGMPVDHTGAPADRKHKIHIDKLWGEFITFANSRNGARYAAKISGIQSPFDNWTIHQRYVHRNDIVQNTANNHKNGANVAMKILSSAILDGVVL